MITLNQIGKKMRYMLRGKFSIFPLLTFGTLFPIVSFFYVGCDNAALPELLDTADPARASPTPPLQDGDSADEPSDQSAISPPSSKSNVDAKDKSEELLDPYQPGPHLVESWDYLSAAFWDKDRPPYDVRIHAPKEPGHYPVILFFPGLLGGNNWFDSTFTHVASHGFVVIVSQLHNPAEVVLAKQLSYHDAKRGQEIFTWAVEHLNQNIATKTEQGVVAKMNVLGLTGFSSGGKVAWVVAKQTLFPISALAGIDPVDAQGDPMGLKKEPHVIDGPFTFGIPVFIIGTGYADKKYGDIAPACAPTGENHKQFFAASQPPTWYVVSLENGHTDIIDNPWSHVSNTCPSGKSTAQEMRDLSRGMLSAFFLASLKGQTQLYKALSDTAAAPTAITFQKK